MGKVKNNEVNNEKKREEKKEQNKVGKFGEKTKKMILIVVSIIAVILLLTICFFISESSVDSTYKIAGKIFDKLESDYDNITLVEEGKDKDFKYSYNHSTLIYIDSIGKQDDDEYAIAVTKYNSNIEAKKKLEFYKSLNKLIHDKYNNTIVGDNGVFDSLLTNNVIIIKGKYLFSINPKMKHKGKIKQYINDIIKQYDISDDNEIDEKVLNSYWKEKLDYYSKKLDEIYDKSIKQTKRNILKYVDKLDGCTGNKCDEILNEITSLEKYADLSEEITSVKNKYNEVIKSKEDIVNSINTSISNVKNSLNQDEFDSIKKRIEELKDTYYDKYKENWNLQLSSVEENIYKNSCSKYSYKDLLRNPFDYQGKKAYFFGKILQKVSSTQYRVGIDCSKYNYISGYHCDNTIYVTYSGDTSLIEDDMVNMWGTMNGNQSYTSVMGASITIPSFNAKYISIN